jgi:hypothetical protein
VDLHKTQIRLAFAPGVAISPVTYAPAVPALMDQGGEWIGRFEIPSHDANHIFGTFAATAVPGSSSAGKSIRKSKICWASLASTGYDQQGCLLNGDV